MPDFSKAILDLSSKLDELAAVLHIEERREKARTQELLMQSPTFWDDSERASRVTRDVAALVAPVTAWDTLKDELRDTSEMATLASEENDNTVLRDLEASLESMRTAMAKLEATALLNDEYDTNNALVSLHAGAGGTDAQDWTEMLARMFFRYAEKKGWQVDVLEESRGEEAGYKSLHFAVRGSEAYGHLKCEAGVHRVVRISPYDAEKMRHTAFALVEVIPELEEGSERDIEIDPKDLRVDTYLSSGKGGQSVNTTYSAIRITHIPTNTVVTCQNERSQQQNRETAMRVLISRLWARMKEERKDKLDDLRGGHKSPEWGNQIRSYVLHPYKQVKDHRTGLETQDVQSVLNGELDPFVEACLKHRATNEKH